MHPDSAQALAPLLALRQGVVLRSELAALGLARLGDRVVPAGRWSRPARQVLVTQARPEPRQLAIAGLLHARPHGMLTGRAACRAYDLRDVPTGGPVDVLVPHDLRRASTAQVQLRRSTRPAERLLVRGLPTVPPARAVVDVALAGATLSQVRGVLLAAVADDLVDLSALEREAALAPQRGGGVLRQVLQEAALGLASAPEAELKDLLVPWCRRRGLRVLFNPWVLVHGRLVGRLDALIEGLGVGAESDSVRHHGSGPALTATLQRHVRFLDLGFKLGHETSWSTRTQPAQVLARLEADVAARRRTGWSPPPGLVVLEHDDPRAPRRRAERWWERPAG